MAIINPRRLSAVPPTQRVDGQPVVATNITIMTGYRPAGSADAYTPLAEEGDAAVSRENGLVVFDLEVLRPQIPADTVLELGARTVEARPDLVTDEFPDGVDLFSIWATGGEIAVANPPGAPTGIDLA